jgi:AraC-like DNA-binding protein
MGGPEEVARAQALRHAKDILDGHFREPIAVDEVATSVGYSPFHFAREFRRTYGESPGRYLARRRIERAQQLLHASDLTVTEICLVVGYTSLGTFSAAFKRAVGVSPTGYRSMAREASKAEVVPACVLLMRQTPPLPPA